MQVQTEPLSQAKPCALRAQGLALSLDLGLCDTLRYLVDVAQETFSEDLTPYSRKVADVREQLTTGVGRLSSAAYCLNSRLEAAMKSGEVSVARRCLAAILYLEQPRIAPTIHCLFDGTFGSAFEEFYVAVFTEEFTAHFPYPFDGTKPVNGTKSLAELSVAMEALQAIEPALHAELLIYVTDFMIIASSHMHAGSSFRAFGLITLREQRPYDHWTVYLEHIVHEAAHLHLFAVWKADTLVLNAPTERFSSPLRPDPRPMSGIFHAMFVLARIAYVYNLFLEDARFTSQVQNWDTAHNSAKNSMTPVQKFRDTFNTVMSYGKLSSLGRTIAESCFDLAHPK